MVFGVFTTLLVLHALAGFSQPQDPQLGPKIDTYLKNKASPITGNGSVFLASSNQYHVDPRLIVAIAGAESSFGTVWHACPPSGYNAWSWFYNGTCANSPFPSFAAGIQTVTKFMRISYFNKGYDTIPAIGGKYCASGCQSWVPNVTQFYQNELQGEPNDLSF